MTVMAAGMHAPRMSGRVGQAGRFDDRQRIDVGAHADCWSIADAQDTDNTRTGKTGMHFKPEGAGVRR